MMRMREEEPEFTVTGLPRLGDPIELRSSRRALERGQVVTCQDMNGELGYVLITRAKPRQWYRGIRISYGNKLMLEAQDEDG